MISKKLLNNFILLILLISIPLTSLSQNGNCGFEYTSENEDYFNSIKAQLKVLEQQHIQSRGSSNSSNVLYSVPIKANFVRTTAGTGGITPTELDDAIDALNIDYVNAGIEFFLCEDINYIDDDTFYDYDSNQESALTAPHNIAGVINMYFTNSIVSNGNGLCGYAYFPGGPETILMAYGCTTSGNTFSHEMGHFFALPHTHGNSNVAGSSQELVDGSNCETTGDFICDTPADPLLGFGNVSSGCIYTGSAQDANFDFYQPDPTNIMSYSRPSCSVIFSPQQYARMNAVLQISRNNLTCPSFNADFIADQTSTCTSNFTVNFTDNSVGATSWAWDVDGDDIIDYTTQNPVHTYNTSGNYDVVLTVSDGTYNINKVKSNYINVGSIEINTATIDLTLNLDDTPSETTWQFLDNNNNVLYSGGPYTGPFDANTTRTATFNINPDECYSFEINDSLGNGICCANGNGSYELRGDDNSLLSSGSNFLASKRDNFYSGVLSIQDFSTESVNLFPNPSSSVITIASQSLPDSYIIYNVLGQVLKQQNLRAETDRIININNFSDGLYFIKLMKENNSQVLSFIRN